MVFVPEKLPIIYRISYKKRQDDPSELSISIGNSGFAITECNVVLRVKIGK
jgi:hypothetical protein